MFKIKVDDEIDLVLVQQSFAPMYEKLAKHNFAYLEKWLAWPNQCRTSEDFSSFIKKSLHDYADGKSMICGILFQGNLVGNIGFNSIDNELKKVEIGYWLVESLRGQGIVTRACRKLFDIAFNELKMQKVQICAATENQLSKAVCQRLGMALEGTITNSENLNGRIVDHCIYGIFTPIEPDN